MRHIITPSIAILVTICGSGVVPYVTAQENTGISGAWKIDTRGGPVPLCNFVQLGNNLKGSCVGPYAAGTVTGTVDGQTVQWRWKWVTYTGNAASGFDFLGTLGADTAITGVVERREIGMSMNFTAKRQELPTAPAAQQAAPQASNQSTFHGISSFQDAQNYYALGPSTAIIAAWRQICSVENAARYISDAQIKLRLMPAFTRQGMQHGDWIDAHSGVLIPGPIPSLSLQEAWNTVEHPVNTGAGTGIDPQIEARAWKLYPFASQQSERTKYIIDEMNAAADRQQGNSYSIHVR